VAELIDALREALAERYAVQRELGRGGMATVFLAEDLKHRRSVAIKVLHAELAAQIGPDRFVREIEIAARLQHPHILPLYDSGEAAGFLYYVMPLVEGESLRDRLNREHQLSQEDTVRITTEVASALSYAHARGVVHRDIKPENILLSDGTAVVADFGIARALDAAGEDQLTQTGTIIGTPAYMSTEQATGSLEIDGRSDQYSLGCVVYEMLVGQTPFTGPTAQAIIARHSIDVVSPPSIVRGTIPEPMEDAILRALSKVPADRFATTALFAEALAKPGNDSGIRRRQTAARSARPGAPRRWARPVAAGGAAVLLIVGVWVAAAWIRGNRAGPGVATGLDPHRVAVLYFQHRGDSAQTQYLADGLTEALIHELSEVKALQVTSANGVRPYRNSAVPPDSVGRALKTGTIVQGTVTEVGERLRLDIALVDGTTGDETKSTRLETPRAELFALQDTLAKAVSAFLRQEIGAEIEVRETRAGTRDVRAWELVLEAEEIKKGVDALIAKGDGANASRELARADSLLAQASARDARWTTPIVDRGWLAWEQRRIAGMDKGPASEWTTQGLTYATAALRIRPDTEALHLRGTMRYIRFLLNLDPAPMTAEQLLDAAELDLRAGGAARSNPRRASALALLSHLLMHRSQTAEGKLAALHAYEADEYLQEASQVLYRLFSASLDLEDAAEAAKWCQQGQRRFPNEWAFTECQISLFALRGSKPDIPKLWRLVDQYAALFPSNLQDYRRRRGQMFVAMALASAGHGDSARAVAQRARADASVDPSRDLVYLEVALRSMLGDRDEAIRLLTLYVATNPQERSSLANDHTWWFAGLRKDPRFEALVGAGS